MAVDMTSQVGLLSPFLKAGMVLLRDGKISASDAEIRHHPDTDANWRMVRVAGLGKAFNIDFEDVFVNAEDMYHMIQRP